MATPRRCPQELVRLPPSSKMTAPATGNASSSQATCCTPTAGRVLMAVAGGASAPAREPVTANPSCASARRGSVPLRGKPPGRSGPGPPGSILQQAGVVNRRRPAGAEDRGQNGEANDDLSGRDDHHEEGDYLAVQAAVQPRERDKREVDRVQHELDAHEDHEGVPAHQHPYATDHE